MRALFILALLVPALAETVSKMELVVPRDCIISVEWDNPSKCVITPQLTPATECVRDEGNSGPFKCTGLIAKVEGCKYVLTKRVGCENVRIVKTKPPEPK